jgi:hypothetical protein
VLFFDINIQNLFDNTHQADIYIGHELNSANWITANKFMANLHKTCKIEELVKILQNLEQYKDFTSMQYDKLEQIDKIFTDILVKAESYCKTNKKKHTGVIFSFMHEQSTDNKN